MSCDKAMRRAEAVMNPVNTEWPRKLASTPSLEYPNRKEMMPVSIDMFRHSCLYSADPSVKLDASLAV